MSLMKEKSYVVGRGSDTPVVHSLSLDLFEEFLHEDVWLKSIWDRSEDYDEDDEGTAPVNIELNDILAEDDQFVFMSPTARPNEAYGRGSTTLAWSFDALRRSGHELYFRSSDLAEDYRTAIRDLGYEEIGSGADAYLLHPDDESGSGADAVSGDGVVEVVLQDMAKVGTLTEPADVKVLARVVAMPPRWVTGSGLSPALKTKASNTIDKWLREIRDFRDAYRLSQDIPDGSPWSSGLGLIWSLKQMKQKLGDRTSLYVHQEVITSSPVRVRDAEFAARPDVWRPMTDWCEEFDVVRDNPARGRRKVVYVTKDGIVGRIRYERQR